MWEQLRRFNALERGARGIFLRAAVLLRSAVSLPLLTFKIIAAIHWEALRLWLKGAALVPRLATPAHVAAAPYVGHQTDDQPSKAQGCQHPIRLS